VTAWRFAREGAAVLVSANEARVEGEGERAKRTLVRHGLEDVERRLRRRDLVELEACRRQ
jgi:hypothetical protein